MDIIFPQNLSFYTNMIPISPNSKENLRMCTIQELGCEEVIHINDKKMKQRGTYFIRRLSFLWPAGGRYGREGPGGDPRLQDPPGGDCHQSYLQEG